MTTFRGTSYGDILTLNLRQEIMRRFHISLDMPRQVYTHETGEHNVGVEIFSSLRVILSELEVRYDLALGHVCARKIGHT